MFDFADAKEELVKAREKLEKASDEQEDEIEAEKRAKDRKRAEGDEQDEDEDVVQHLID